ncbi:MAG: hypothetical protein KJ927_10765, partial [Candidatus Eisenbacteria bacterium]|nr:hypothetical protein [Candidatus Eisenbacteria bacterium]
LACSQLVILPASTQDGTDAKILGFSAPGPPVTNFPVRESDGYPKYNTEGNYNLWNLDDKIEVRVPICDYSEENVETAYDALKLHLQSCGPNWVFDFNDDGEFYIKKRDTESEPELTLVASDEDSSDWSDRKIHLLNLHRKPLAGDDVQNQISIVPYIADIPTVGVKLSLVARREDINPCVQVSAHALSDSARRVVLTCVRDGIAGILEGEISGVPVGREGDWASSVLFSVAEDTQEFLTELAADFDTASNICSLVGLRYHPDGYNRHRLLGDAEIWSTRDLGNTMPPAGDYIFIGDEARATIKRFTTVNEMQLTPSAEWVAPIIPRGTTVKIVPMRGYKAVQEYQTGLEGHGQIIDTIPATGNPVTIYVTPTEFPYTGYVAEIGYEAFLITRVSRLDSADGYYPGQKELLATRAYFDTEMAIHYGGAPIRFYLHPIHGRPVYIGNTGLVAQFNVENTDNIEERRWLVGDVVELDFTGARAVKAEFFTATSDSPSSILRSGKKKLTLDENYYISTLVAPHLAYALTQYLKDPKLPFDAEIPYAPWISGVNRIRVRSEYDLPDEPNNEIICVLRGYAHYSSQRKTILNLISETAAAGDPEAATGMGVPEGGIV